MNYYNTLDVLKSCSNEELQPLVDLLENTSTNSLSAYESYNKNKGNPKLFVNAIYDEVREFGGNTFANLYRGEGVPYKEVVQDVAKNLKVQKRSSDLIELERQLLAKVLESAFEKLSEKERNEMFSELGQKDFDPSIVLRLSTLKGPAITAILTTSPYLMQQIIKVLINQGVKTAAKNAGRFAGSRALSILAGPVGWVIGGVWTAFDIAAPATRVTLPCVVHIAAIRLTKMNEENNNKYNKYK
jgi:uncharacterized protein YaaW (UPF0174 family)